MRRTSDMLIGLIAAWYSTHHGNQDKVAYGTNNAHATRKWQQARMQREAMQFAIIFASHAQ